MKTTLTIVASVITIIVLVLYSQLAFGDSLVAKDTSGIYTAQDGESEMVASRTRSFKKFSKGRQRRVAGQIGPIHYRTDPFSDTEQYKEIDLTINLTPDESWDASMESNGYQVRFWQSRVIAGKTIRYIAQFRRAGKWLAMCPLALIWENDAGQKQLISKPVAGIAPVIDNDSYTVTWIDCFGSGLHYRYNVNPDHFFKTVIIDNKTDLPAPIISGSGLKLTVVLGISWHSQSKAANGFAGNVVPDVMPNDTDVSGIDEELVDSGVFAYQDESLRNTFWMKRPKAWDSAEERHAIAVEWRLRRRGNRVFAALFVPATALNNPAVEYPIFIDVDISEEQVGAGLDDGFTDSGQYFGNRIRGDIIFNYDAGFSIYALARFSTVPIPQGVAIDSAAMSIYIFSAANHDNAAHDIYCEDIDDSPDLGDANPIIDLRDLTTATTAWYQDSLGLNLWVAGPDIAPSVEEVVARGGWVSGNALSVITIDTQAAKRLYGLTYESAGGVNAPKFNASYTEAASGAQVMSIKID